MEPKDPSSHHLLGSVLVPLPLNQEPPYSGLATRSTNFGPQILCSLFQLLSLLGFPLQSFTPFKRSFGSHRTIVPLLRFHSKTPVRLLACASVVYSHLKSRSPLCSQAFYSLGGAFCSLVVWTSQVFPSPSFERKHLPFFPPLPLFLPAHFSVSLPTNLRVSL